MVTRNLPLAEQVRLRILEWIHDGTLGLGDGSLPSETEIAERLNTSRATVREALSQLDAIASSSAARAPEPISTKPSSVSPVQSTNY